MRTDLTAGYITEMSKKLADGGHAPYFQAEFYFASGTVTIDGDLVKNWGEWIPMEDIQGPFGPIGLEVKGMEVINISATPFSNYLANNVPSNTLVKIYQGFIGQADVPEVDRFYIGSYDVDDNTGICRLNLISVFRRHDKRLGRILNRADLPDASYGTVGKSLGYVLNKVPDVPLMPLAVGWQSALVEDITATQTGNLYFRYSGQAGKVTDLPVSGTIIIGDEEITYTSWSYSDPASSTDTHNNYIVVPSTGRAANARPYQAGTVAIEKLATGYTYGFPMHECRGMENIKVGGIPQSSGFTVNLADTVTLLGETLATVNFTKHPRRVKGVGSHSHINRREVKRSGLTGTVTFGQTGTFVSTANVPDSTKLGTAQNGYIDVTFHVYQFNWGSGHLGGNIKFTLSGAHLTSQIIYSEFFSPSSTELPPSITVRIPINNPDWSSDMFSLNIMADSQYGSSSGGLCVDGVEWHVEYTGGDSINAEVKDRIDVAGTIGSKNIVYGSYATRVVTANVPSLVAIPQEIYIKLRLRISSWNFVATTSATAFFQFSGAHITTQVVQSMRFYTTSNHLPNLEVLLRLNNPDLSADCFALTVGGMCDTSSHTGSFEIEEATWIVEYPLGDAEVLNMLEVVSDGPLVTADITGYRFGVTTEVDNCDTASNWVASGGNITISQGTSVKQEGTGSVKMVSAIWPNQMTQNSYKSIRYSASSYHFAQTNINIPANSLIDKISLMLDRNGSPSGNIYIELRKGQSDGKPRTNDASKLIATSNNVNVNTIVLGAWGYWTDFTFPANTSVGALDGYGVDIIVYATYAVSSSNLVHWGMVTSNAYSGVSGLSQIAGNTEGAPNTWTRTNYDFCFKVYLKSYGELTRSAIDLSVVNKVRIWVRSSVAGADILQFQMGETVATQHTFNVSLSQANVFERKEIDISGKAEASRDALTKFRLGLADGFQADVTMYFDYIEGYGDDPLSDVPADHVLNLANITGLYCDGSLFDEAKAAFQAAAYSFAGLIAEYPLLSEVLIKMQVQGRFALWISQGALKVRFMPDTHSSAATVTETQMVKRMKVVGGGDAEVSNLINLFYAKRWYIGDYFSHITDSDAVSIAEHGTKEMSIECDMITDDAMAISVRDFYLTRKKDKKRLFLISVFPDNFKIEHQDGLGLTYTSPTYAFGDKPVRVEYPPMPRPGYVEMVQDENGGYSVKRVPFTTDLLLREFDRSGESAVDFDTVNDVDALVDFDTLV